MRSLMTSRVRSVRVAAVLAMVVVMAMMLVVGGTATVAAKRPPKPSPSPSASPSPSPPPTGSVTIQIAPSGTLEPNQVYASVDVTVTCPVGWTWSSGSLYVRQADPGGAGSFSVACTGTPQVGQARVVNGNRFTLGNATATAYVTIVRNGQQAQTSSTRTIRLEPGVTARIADQGQLTGTSGGGVRIAVAVACPVGATPDQSFVSVSQDGTALGSASFNPVCDRQTRTFVLSITASQGTFHTGSAVAEAFATVTWDGQGFYGIDSRSVTLLESSTGDSTPPTTPAGLSASTFGDTETWLDWSASSDNATPTGLIVYEVYLNGRFDQGIGGGYTQAILYADAGVLNTIEVFAIDGAGNRSAPATVTVDMRP
jgi:hypothetical protein